MNERIEGLIKQAGTDTSGKWVNVDNARTLIKLTVQECIDTIKPNQHHEAFAQGYVGGVDGLELLDGKIRNLKHKFGLDQ
jgi:hypothetical protein